MGQITDGLIDRLRKERTCEWLAVNTTYAIWRDSTANSDPQSGQAHHAPILWLQANPGTGKSTLTSYTIDTIPKYWPDAAISYYFYRFDQSSEPIKILKFLALQLFRKYRKTPDTRKSACHRVPENMWSMLTSMRHDGSHTESRTQEFIRLLVDELPRVYFVLDGLDEERDSEKLARIVGFLVRVAAGSSGKVRLWCSSQSQPALVTLRELTTHHMLDVDEQMTATVRAYLEREVPLLPQYVSQEQKAQILEKLLKRVEGNFMWAKLVIGEVAKAQSAAHIQRIIDKNKSMDTYYERFFSRFIDSDRELAW